jgi:hypothetical protein
MAFQHAHAEEAGKTPIARMRLTDMRRVAAAYDISIDHNTVADGVRPTLIAQEAKGTFTKPCPHPERLEGAGYAKWRLEGGKVEEGPTKAELLAELEALKAKVVPEPTEEKIANHGEVKFRGPKHRWCRMEDGEWITGFESREAAEA